MVGLPKSEATSKETSICQSLKLKFVSASAYTETLKRIIVRML